MFINFDFDIDKFYACGKFGSSTVNTYGSQSFVMKLDMNMKVEKFKFITINLSGSTDGQGIECAVYSSNLYGFMVTASEQLIFTKIDIPNMSTIQGYGYNRSSYNDVAVSYHFVFEI